MHLISFQAYAASILWGMRTAIQFLPIGPNCFVLPVPIDTAAWSASLDKYPANQTNTALGSQCEILVLGN